MPKSKPPYPAEFRQQIVELAKPAEPAELAREFGCSCADDRQLDRAGGH